MDIYLEPMRKMMMLTDSSIEALEHLKEAMKIDEKQMPLYLLGDVYEAYKSIQNAYKIFGDKLPINDIEGKFEIVFTELSAVGYAIEVRDITGIYDLLQTGLLPAYKKFRQEMAECFNPYILC